MSLKTPESRLLELRLPYQIVYDDEESYPDGSDSDPATKIIAWLYSANGKDVGSWNGTMKFSLCDNPARIPTEEELVALTQVVEELR